MDTLIEKARDIFNKKRAERLRHDADNSGEYCVYATLYEINSLMRGRLMPRPSKIINNYRKEHGSEISPKISPKLFFDKVGKEASRLGIEIDEVYSEPSFLDHFDIPEQLAGRVRRVTGYHSIKFPSMLILAKKTGDNKYKTHAETRDGTPETQDRIDELIKAGWEEVMVICFKKPE